MVNDKGKSSTGLDGNVAGLLSYALGLFTGILFLVLEKNSRFVKFHAMQSILISAVLIIINMILGFIPIIGWILGVFITPVIFILWLFLMYQAYQGKWFKLPIIGDVAEKQAGIMFK
ncbi:MAG TPA: hypothetical protein VGE40_01700 [Bacilli bacterium]